MSEFTRPSLVPASGPSGPFVASLALPRSFLQAKDAQDKQCFCKTTTLECLGFISILCLDPMRFIENDALFHIDNVASVRALEKGRSRDAWATTLIRAARVVAAALGCSLFADWERRRSTRNSEVADDLTHILVAKLTDDELRVYLQAGNISFPEPILNWMASPTSDLTMGYRCVMWIHEHFPEVALLRPALVFE